MSTPAADPNQISRQVRRRLFILLLQAFAAVLLLAVAVFVGLSALAFSVMMRGQGNWSFSPPIANSLEAYYKGRGSWEGVAAAFADTSPGRTLSVSQEWARSILLDADGIVLVDHRDANADTVGKPYQPSERAYMIDLYANGRKIGALVFESATGFEPLLVFVGLVPPMLVVLVFTGALILVIGFLLARRFVSPLADVVAAAQAVATGDLSARVLPRQGEPGDLRALSDSFNRMAAALEQNDRTRRDLLADIAHELRTPLTIIRGRLEGIVDGVYPADEDHVAPVLEETYMLERLVEDLRLLTLAESGQLHFDMKPIEVAAIVQRASALFEAQATEKNITLAVHTAPDLPVAHGDPQRVEQVIGNLIGNALRYVPEGGRVSISVQRAGDATELSIADNGPGVSEAELPHLFDRFWRGEKSRARAAGGAGLGLAIVRQLVEAQGGRIVASNVAGGGLKVSVLLK